MKVKDVKLTDIIVGERFRQDMGDISELRESIEANGLLSPIVVTEGLKLIAGGRRFAACEMAELKKIPCVIRADVDGEADLRELELVENIFRKDMSWHERAKLEARIFELKSESDPNWSQRKQAAYLDESKGAVGRRLQLAEVLEAIPELADAENEDKAWKAYKRLEEDVVVSEMLKKSQEANKGVVKYAKGHYILGDAVEGIKAVHDETVHFAEVDPPYGVDLDKRKARNESSELIDRYNEVPWDEYPDFILSIARETYRALAPNAFCVWWFGMSRYQETLDVLRTAGFKVNDIPAIWTKGAAGQTASPDTALGSCYEPFFVCRKGMPKLRKSGRSNLFDFKPIPSQKKIHTTEKPIELLTEIIDTFSWPQARILVPFMGSGVTVRAAYRAGTMGFGWDMDEIIKNRFLAKVQEDIEAGWIKE
jgi:adenine-specific DNA-methyltransferase